MCMFCGSKEEKELARRNAMGLSNQLYRMSLHYKNLANGTIKPHSDEIKRDEALALTIIRRLVDDWI